MAHNFTRPNLPYDNDSLPNDNRFVVLTRNLQAPATDIMLDSEFNAIIDYLNQLDADIAVIESDGIAGANNPDNINLLPTTDGAGNISWVPVSDNNCRVGSIDGNKLINSSVTAQQLQDGAVLTNKLAVNSVTTPKIANLSVTTAKIANNAVTATQIANQTITATQIADNTITATQIANQTITEDQIADNTITTTQIAADAGILGTQLANNTITADQIAASLYNMIAPIGTIIMFGGTIGMPAGWLEGNGQAVSRVTYATLFANYGTIYGAGDGVNTFNLPDLRGRIPVGIGSDSSTGGRITNATAPTIALGATGVFGEETHQLTVNELASHAHAFTIGNNGFGLDAPGGTLFGGATDYNTESTGGNQAHNNTQPSIFTRYYIRAL